MGIYADIAQKWITNNVNDEDVTNIKHKITEILPSWKYRKINIIESTDNRFMIISEPFDEFIWLTNNDEFTIEYDTHTNFIPCFEECPEFYKKDNIIIGFGKITGLGYIIVDKKNIYQEYFFKTNEDFIKSFEFIKNFNCFDKYNNNTRYFLFWEDKFDWRINEWIYNNKYKEFEKLGMLSDNPINVKSSWIMKLDTTETIKPFNPNELLSYEDFIEKINDNFSCLQNYSTINV
jgi:hypothetical protein